jgi:tetratricopeptide (TPR) repeat protein
VIVLEDLHWADRGTLDLLLHASRNLQGARLLIVGTYRDVEVDRSHPLSGVLADLRRSANFSRLPLRGLTVDEVHRMYEAIRGNSVDWSQAEAVHRQTEGNPLFVQEVLRYLVEEGFVVREDGRWVPTQGVGAGIPEGLRDVVGKRLSRLSEKTNQVLAIAAVMGRDFRLDVLQQVAGLPEDELYSALAEAVERAVVEERSGVGAAVAYRFAHAFFRQTLYEETIAPRRIRLHQQVARALETVYGRRLEEHAAELAEHYSYSSSPDDLRKAVEYGELAAQRATSVFDYGEAERHLAQALKVQEVLDPDDKLKRCDLLLALGEAMLPQENPGRTAATVNAEAFDLAEASRDPSRAARVALQAIEALARATGSESPTVSPESQEWAARADRNAQLGTRERVYTDIAMGMASFSRSPAEAHVYLRRAVERALELGEDTAFFAAAATGLRRLQALRDRHLVERIAEGVVARDRDNVRTRDLSACLLASGDLLFGQGKREEAESVWRELDLLSARTRDATLAAQKLAGPAFLAYVDGRLDEALTLIDAFKARAQELGIESVRPAGLINTMELARILYYLGRPIEPLLATLEGAGRPSQGQRAVLLGYLGRLEEAAAIRESFGDVGSKEDESGLIVLVSLLELSVLCGLHETAKALLPRLAPLADNLIRASGLSIGRILGDAAVLLAKPDEARVYYAQALEVCERVRFRPEVALIRLDLAELLLEHYPDERDAAIEHLDFAIPELRDMKMQPALERALRHRGLLKA